MSKDKFILIIAGLAIVLAGTAFVVSILKTSPAQLVDNVGSSGSLAIENYLPIIKHNEGYYSELPISLSGANGDLTISSGGTLTVSGATTISGATDLAILTYGGSVLATSTSGTATTLTQAILAAYTAIEMTPNVASFTYTLPASSTITSLMPNSGDRRSWTWQNAATATSTEMTIAAGTGWNLSGVDANVDVIPGAAYTARELLIMDCYRQANTDINCELRENVAAD